MWEPVCVRSWTGVAWSSLVQAVFDHESPASPIPRGVRMECTTAGSKRSATPTSFYPAGSTISEGTDRCGCTYGTYCTQDGGVIVGDCFPTCCIHEGNVIDHGNSYTDSSGAQCLCEWGQALCMAPPIVGCQMGGSFYPAGSTISEGTDQCGCTYGTYCTQDGHIMIGDCFPTCCVHEGSVIDHDSSFTDGAGAQCRCSWGQLECTISAISG
ncbi:hypothetical protein Bbelb_235360 [Branchiostoma belcheri]|nr:hypothetical protein Bbelb_235360 [Branchiostoma belcheri]